MQNYLETVTAVLKLMREPDSPCKDVKPYRTCYVSLFKYLLEEELPFSVDTAMNWLESKTNDLSPESYANYRKALFRLEHYLLFGNIKTPFCHSDDFLFCRSGMSESFYRLTYELKDYMNTAQNPCYYHTYSVETKEFFRFATAHGITEPEAISIDLILDYWNEYCLQLESLTHRQKAVCAMTALMKYLYKRGDVPACYQMVLPKENAEKLKKMKLPKAGNAAHPSIPLESQTEGFLNALDDWKYKESSKSLYQSDIVWYCMFLELNHFEHTSDAIRSWGAALPDCPNQKNQNCSISARRIHTIRMFDVYLKKALRGNIIQDRPLAIDSLPEWGHHIISGFLESRRRDGMAEKTIVMCRSAGNNFFQYLEKNGICSPHGITPEIVKEFHFQDHHSTPESKNAYMIKLRQLLNYMADEGLVPATLVYAVSTSCASRRVIVDVLSDEAVEKIYEYRSKASTPLELRDIAIVMLGLRMGIRGTDILNLKISDFDWKNKTVSFIQRKTRKAITLPFPVEVGNSVYKYISCGRPKSADAGNGYVFIRHQAPYIPLSGETTSCKSALKRVLADSSIELKPGQGFHMTRKTFATRMLRADNRLDDIANALGHVCQQTTEVYLERDEKNMRLCPLSFGGVL